MWIKEALEAVPDLILVDGSDLTHYRQFSSDITAVVQTFTPAVERLGMDENFVDATDIVKKYLEESDTRKIEGHVYGDKKPNEVVPGDPCGCGCQERLIAGTRVAKKLRQQIFETTGITCCAGIAHNKLLAKLVGGYYKPNQQTVLFPWSVHQVMSSLHLAKSIPGIGSSTFKILEELGIYSVKDLQNSSLTLLHSKFDDETSKRLKDLSFGIDHAPVRRSGRPQSIGLEDAFKKVNSITVVQTKYITLLERLLKLLKEDGRIPSTLRVCVRKFDSIKRFGNRESRQVPVLPSLFVSGVENIGENTRTSLMDQIMGLFHKMVDTSKDYHLTLLGIGFCKFIERATKKNSISRFFKRRRTEKEDQHINEEKSEDPNHLESSSVNSSMSDSYIHSSKVSLESSTPDDCNSEDVRNLNRTTGCEDMFPKFHAEISERKILQTSKGNSSRDMFNGKITTDEEATGETNLDSNSYDTSSLSTFCKVQNPSNEDTPSDNDSITRAPHGIDEEVFQALPQEIQDEILLTYKKKPPDPKPKPPKIAISPKKSHKIKLANATLDNYFKQNSMVTARGSREAREIIPKEINEASSPENKTESATQCNSSSGAMLTPERMDNEKGENMSVASSSSSATTLQPPDGVDPSVFNALPKEIQQEIVEEHRRFTLVSGTPHASRSSSHAGRRRGTSSSIMMYIKKV